MKGTKPTYSIGQSISSIFMVLALLWLTVSTPFVYAAQEAQQMETSKSADECQDTNPFSNTTEEKNESSTSTLSEYLHETSLDEHNFIVLAKYYKCHSTNLYLEYHPQLISPPPEA